MQLNEYIDQNNDNIEMNDTENVSRETPTKTIKDILMADSPDVPIENYIDHPLNFKNSKALARVIRGLEGMVGTLRKALIDIFMGSYEFYSDERSDKNVS